MLVVARLSASERRHENGELPPGALVTTRGDLVSPPATVVERVPTSDTRAPPSTTDVCGSQIALDRIVLGIGVPGAQGSVL